MAGVFIKQFSSEQITEGAVGAVEAGGDGGAVGGKKDYADVEEARNDRISAGRLFGR